MRHADDPTPIICQGEWCGEIANGQQGENGFGYDPVFWVKEHLLYCRFLLVAPQGVACDDDSLQNDL